MNKDKQARLEGDRFFGEARTKYGGYGFTSRRSNEETGIMGLNGPESMPYIRNSETDARRWLEQSKAAKSKSDSKINEDFGFF